MIDVLNSDASSPIQKLHELQVIIGITERCGSEFSGNFSAGTKKALGPPPKCLFFMVGPPGFEPGTKGL